MVDPRIMCRKHLLGEHVELHMMVSTIRNGLRLGGYVKNNLIEASSIGSRHSALVFEMRRRGYDHKSPIRYDSHKVIGKIDRPAALQELLRRCPDCRQRHKEIHS